MRRASNKPRVLDIPWSAAVAAMVLAIAQVAPSARAQGTKTLPGTAVAAPNAKLPSPPSVQPCPPFGPGSPPPIRLCVASVVGGDATIGTVTLGQPVANNAKSGVSVQVTSSSKDVTIAPLTPASLTIEPGQTSVQFAIVSSPVKSTETVQIAACSPSPPVGNNCLSLPENAAGEPLPGYILGLTNVVLTANGPASVSMNPATVTAGSSSMGTVQLQYPAPQELYYYKNTAPVWAPKDYVQTLRQGGATVTLKSISGVTVTPSITISSGRSSATFNAATSQSAASTVPPSSCTMGPSALAATITATWEQSASGTLEIEPQKNSQSRYTSKTIRIDPSTIVGVSHDGLALALVSTPCSQMLKAGSVMFVKGLGVLDVGKVATFPSSQKFLSLLSHQQLAALQHNKTTGTPQGGIAVGVSSASLTDFINEGNVKVDLKNPVGASEPGGGGSSDPFTAAAEPNSEQPTGVTPWKYTGSGTPLSYSFTAFKNNNGLSGSVTAKGEIAKDECAFLAVIHGDKVEEAMFTAAMEGSVDVDWIAQDVSGNDIGDSRLRMLPLFSGLVVDDPDGIPFLFQIDANLIFKPGFGEKAAAKGHFKITFKGDGGIDGSSPVDDSLHVTPEISSTTSSAKAAHGAVVAVNVPKFAFVFSDTSFMWATWNRQPAAMSMKASDFADNLEAQLGTHLSNNVEYPDPKDYFKLDRGAYVQWAYSVAYAGSGLLAMFQCQQYYQNYLVQAGIDKKMLGSISGSIPPDNGVEAFKKTHFTAIPAIQGCYPKK